jgi:NAD(P)-dependent dehydrogenase (short-subunit alcohol dehydrogenase family)
MDIKDKVVLVTGASSDIGKATAELFSRKGAKVVLAARSIEEVKELAAKLPDSLVVAVDMTKPQEVQQMVQQTHAHYGRIDVLINNAGPGMHAPFEHIEVDDFARLMSLNVYGPLVAMQTTIPLMKKQGGGAIVNISSGILQATQSTTPQIATTKSALNMIPLNTRTEYTDSGISVSTVYPREPAANVQRHLKRRKGSHKRQQTETLKHDLSQTVAATIVETVEKGIAVEFH